MQTRAKPLTRALGATRPTGATRAVRSLGALVLILAAGATGAATRAAHAVTEADEGGLPQLTQTDTYLSQVFWLVVFFAILYLLLDRLFLPRLRGALDERRARIASDVSRAERLAAKASETEAESEAALEVARRTLAERLAEARAGAESEAAVARARQALDLESELSLAESSLTERRREAHARLEALAAPWARSVAERLAGVSVSEAQAATATAAAHDGEADL